MDFLNRREGLSADALWKFTDLSTSVQKHLEQVYLTLAALVLVAASGVAVQSILHIEPLVCMIGFAACSYFLASTPPNPKKMTKKVYALAAGTALFQGAAAAPLVQMALALHPGVLVTAFLGTAAVFACFSAAALVSRRRSYLYLTGTLASAMSGLLLMRVASIFLGSTARGFTFSAELYGGLLIFVGWVLVDTQQIIEKASNGDEDHIQHRWGLKQPWS
eukprot:jgi/Astpho2/3251/fgenesh1_pg.00052_%23_53_t